jgi:sarcosine oxidase subunit alpha
MAERLPIKINGKAFAVLPGTTVASAILNTQTFGFRKSVSQGSRGPVCGMGICYECRATIDGVSHQRSCMIVCAAGMVIETDG